MKLNPQTDIYFHKTAVSAKDNPRVRYQVFQKRDAILSGTAHMIELLKQYSTDERPIVLRGLKDGAVLKPGAPTHIIEGNAQDLLQLETLYLGMLAEETKIATNVRAAVNAAKTKPVLFFPARFTLPGSQCNHGYAAGVGGASGCSTTEQMAGWNEYSHSQGYALDKEPVGTMPHAAIAIAGGDTVEASLRMAERLPDEPIWPLVDFENDCAKTAVQVFKAFQARGIESRMIGVRLDTSERLVDEGIAPKDVEFRLYTNSTIGEHGVNPTLVRHVRKQLDQAGAQAVKICVSGGFSPAKIQRFEEEKVPADVYAVGEYFLTGSFPFTSDIVGVQTVGGQWNPVSKVGRGLMAESEGFQTLYQS